MAAYWEIAAHSTYDLFYKYLIVNLFFSTSVFGVGLRLFLSIAFSVNWETVDNVNLFDLFTGSNSLK